MLESTLCYNKLLTRWVAFASTLQTHISSETIDDVILANIRAQIKALLFVPLPAEASYSIELDGKGLELWNTATRLRQDHQPTQNAFGEQANDSRPPTVTFACITRAFAFFLLDAGWQITVKIYDGKHVNESRRFANAVRIMKVALKAGKTCVATDELDLAMKVLERAAAITEGLSDQAGACSDEADTHLTGRLTSEYYILRTMLAWKQSRLDLAEHMFTKAEANGRMLDAKSAEELADTLHEMGKDLFQNGHNEVAVRWLDRAHDILVSQELEQLSMDAADLKMSIMQTLIKALLGQRTSEARSKAADLVQLMEVDYPEKLLVSLLRLDLLLSEEKVDCEQYFTVIVRMVRSVPLTDANIRTLLYHIHKLKDLRADLAVNVLEGLLRQRLLAEPEKEEWIEKVLLTIVWIVSDIAKSNDGMSLDELRELFNAVLHALHQPLSVTAAHGAQTLLWGCIDSTYTTGRFEKCANWCRLSLHRLFENCGDMNKSKISRKLIMCVLSMQKVDMAREVYYQMSEGGKSNPLTRFLMYKVALQSRDTDFAAESLNIICKASSKDVTLLYACVVEAQTVGDRQQAALALQKVLSQYNYNAPKGVNLPALLRCMIRLVMSHIHDDEPPTEQALDEICKIFETAVSYAKKQPQGHKGDAGEQNFGDNELQWFARSSYNMALKYCANVHPYYLIRLLNSCAALLTLMLEEKSDNADEGLHVRLSHCFWLIACTYVTIARAEDNTETSNQAYLAVRRCGTDFRSRFNMMLKCVTQSQTSRDDLSSKHFQVIKFELEAALKLRQWDAMDEIFEHCWSFNDSIGSPGGWDNFADLVLVIHAAMVEAKLDPSYLRKILVVLQTIINHTQRAQTADTIHLARWLRCLFQIAADFSEDVGLQCLEQSHIIAQRTWGTSQPFPNVELEWLATTAFNRAVDYYCTSDDVKTKLWVEKALMLAGDVDDGGNLRQLLEEKYSGLSWDA